MYKISEVIPSLKRKSDVRIKRNTIFIDRTNKRSNDLGNKSLGKIDFLKAMDFRIHVFTVNSKSYNKIFNGKK